MNRETPIGGAITFHHAIAFWLGTGAVTVGVLAHIPMFINAADMNFRLVGMQISPLMTAGMYGIVIGTLFAWYGLFPSRAQRSDPVSVNDQDVQVRAMDDVPLSAAHWKVITVLLVAVIVDVMKPATLGFVIPGAAEEYGLTKSQVAAMPAAGIIGTAMGSLIWGYLGDTMGRRASILLASIIFIGTAICGAMPSFAWNVFMCWLMGFGAGGLLPIAFALLAEIVPRRHRGWLLVLIGGVGTVGGYLAASGAAALLEPHFGWRILWFLGAPTGLLLIVLNRYIPESPRFLFVHGKRHDAERIMSIFGAKLVRPATLVDENVPPSSGALQTSVDHVVARPGNLRELFRPPHTLLAITLGLYGLAWSLVTFGFLLWLPASLRGLGMSAEASVGLLAKSAIIAFPSTLLVAWLYHSWSSIKTMLLAAMLMVAALGGFASLGTGLADHEGVLILLVVTLLISSSGVISLLLPYSAEVFPSHIRATGSGWAAANSKLGGVATLLVAVAGLVPSLVVAAVVTAIPPFLAAVLLRYCGVETRGLRLEEIQALQRQST